LVEGTSLDDLNKISLETYRNQIRNENPSFPYKNLPDDQFCDKVGISNDGKLTIGGILMLGQRDVVQRHVSNFWIDYLEIPGKSLADARVRYTYRMPEQENIWESYQIILQRLRNFVDAPYEAHPDGVGAEDESQLYALREGLTNCCAHADYFSPMHPTIRVFADRIELQNPGRFMFPLSELRTQIHSIPRNPKLIKFFRYAKLGENAGYGIDKMLAWERLTKGKVEFASDLVSSTITYWFGEQPSGIVSGTVGGTVSGMVGGIVGEPVQLLINTIGDRVMGISELQAHMKIKSRRYIHEVMLTPAIEGGYVLRSYPDKPSHPKQRYYLSEKGLKLVK
jgi:ATP-dependent DNA helicase RecG